MDARLEALRGRIAAVDQELVHLAAERLTLATAVGQAKLAQGLPIRNYETEAEVLARYRRHAEGEGVEPEFARRLATLLIGEAVRRQEDGRTPEGEAIARATPAGSQRILVVGGGGKMGRWLARFFRGQGHSVTTQDPAGPVEGFPHVEPAAGVADFEVIVLAIPLSQGPEVLRGVLAQEPRGLVVDISSLKSHLLADLRAGAARGLRVASLHPLFGPEVRTLAGRIVAVCDCGHRGAAADAARLFEGTALTITRIPVERHDEYMQYGLGLSHLVSILFFTTLIRAGASFDDLATMASTTFHKQVRTAAEVASENAEMYAEIQRLNRHSIELYGVVRE
ncbi:MAG: prephenate dehydrogenase/arogenate dehydrogenase family protein, partial [Gemmatimonadota bacterium]